MGTSLDLLVLCAGRGERLRPLTDVCPKPLLPLAGVAMADRALAACEVLSPLRRLANAHHLPEQILAWAEARRIDHVQVEPVLLDTGGAIGRLESEGELLSDHLLVHNGDLVHDLDLRQAWAEHLRSGVSATLLVVDRPSINTVVVAPDGAFAGVLGHPRGPASILSGFHSRTFSGIAFYHRGVFSRRPAGPWSVKELWHDLLENDGSIRVWEAPSGALWDDLGSAHDLSRAVREELSRRGLERWVDPDAQVSGTARIGLGCAVEFGARVGAGASVERSVLFPGSEVEAGEVVADVLRNPGGDLVVSA